MVRTSWVNIAVLAAVVLIGRSIPAYAEVYNPFGEGTMGSSSGTSSTNSALGAAGDISGFLTPTSTVQDHSAENEMRGRKDKTIDSIDQGGAGVAGAVTAGTLLTAEGVRLLPWPTTPQGLALIALGSTEFAQAGATAGTRDENIQGRDVLSKGTSTGGQPSAADVRDEIAKKVNTPELQDALAKYGVNPDEFVDKLASGQLNSPDQVMQAAGIRDDISSDALQQALNQATQDFSAGKYGNGKEEMQSISMDEKQPATSGMGGGGGSGSGNSEEQGGKAGGTGEPMPVHGPGAMGQAVVGVGQGPGKGELNSNGLVSATDLIKKFTNSLNSGKSGVKKDMTDLELAKFGIKRLRQKQCIFQLARRTYRSYKDWRDMELKKSRIAMRN